jgi:hypothetical protein
MVPNEHVNAFTADVVKRFARALGEDVLDPATTRATEFPVPVYMGPDEDSASFPTQVVVVGASLAFCLVWRRRDARVFGYALTCVAVGIAYAATIRWQWFGNRLLLPGLAVAAPLAGLAVDALARRFRAVVPRVVVTVGLVLVVFVAGYGGVNAILFGAPRPLYGPQSVLTVGRSQALFTRVPAFRPDYEWAAARIRAAGARRVGIVENYVVFEYPWWRMLPDREFVSLESVVPGHPAVPATSVDAIVCFAPTPPTCMSLIPPGWNVQFTPAVTVAVPSAS